MKSENSDTLSIGMVAAQLGVTTATLRKWEERYGVPRPLRLPSGTRRYPKPLLRHLQRAVRLINGGVPTATALTLAADEATPEASTGPGVEGVIIDAAYADLRSDDLISCEHRLRQGLSDHGVVAFVDGVLAPLLRRVGDGWLSGELEVFHEHALTERISALLRDLSRLERAEQPSGAVLLATPPGERHTLGIAMVEAALAVHGARCINLGPEMPCDQLVLAAHRFDAAVVGIGLSKAAPPRLTQQFLNRLRVQLPESVSLWLGGEGASSLGALPKGMRYFDSVADAVQGYQTTISADKALMTGTR